MPVEFKAMESGIRKKDQKKRRIEKFEEIQRYLLNCMKNCVFKRL